MPFGGLLTAGIIGGSGSIISGLLGSSASEKAAQTQADAAKYAADLQAKTTQSALDLQKSQYDKQLALQEPFYSVGLDSVRDLRAGLGAGGVFNNGGFAAQAPAPFSFKDFNLNDDPGYQFRMDQGQQALQRSAAAQGGALGGGALKAIARYGQDYASGEFNNAYNRALGTYNTNFTNAFNTYNSDQGNLFNRLAALGGVGQTAVNTMSNAGTSYANNAAQTAQTGVAAQNNLTTQGANARASGYIGGANAWGGALGGLTNTATTLSLANLLR
jgi:hypothetical protein